MPWCRYEMYRIDVRRTYPRVRCAEGSLDRDSCLFVRTPAINPRPAAVAADDAASAAADVAASAAAAASINKLSRVDKVHTAVCSPVGALSSFLYAAKKQSKNLFIPCTYSCVWYVSFLLKTVVALDTLSAQPKLYLVS